MLKMSELQEMVNIIDRSSVNVFTFEYEGMKIKLEKTVGVQQTDQNESVIVPVPDIVQKIEKPAEKKENNADHIVSPMVGTFYASSSPEEEPFVNVGASVKAGEVVCVLEAMKLFNEVQSEVDGEIVEILVKDGDIVEYGQPLFVVKKSQ
ncbi:acetyl-CoA carboxylase biotin carboxyl carrier protein [Domibacillus epiphyticus]|uniref:Biotin carboxyl carrier protein of acetyl-CoA carboxylase n=1 Tax=Domibacillus epiphyticus TaxID=1714355 RepID=A0A1V2AAT7_9BACI|nr:acetyl-CoA carboxylase biotin carboxyl carrier protein [Domibacillus epiphyticus]OMP68101.1 acetyl-CoA carboxylase, biotin carboxyl carrier protein [Domibacillus epiphyticus]